MRCAQHSGSSYLYAVCIQHLLHIEIKRRLPDYIVFFTEVAGYKLCLAQKRLVHLGKFRPSHKQAPMEQRRKERKCKRERKGEQDKLNKWGMEDS